jgi:hypothetical protein
MDSDLKPSQAYVATLANTNRMKEQKYRSSATMIPVIWRTA